MTILIFVFMSSDFYNIICNCYGITKEELKNILLIYGCNSIQCVQKYCDAGKGCKTCLIDIQNFIHKHFENNKFN